LVIAACAPGGAGEGTRVGPPGGSVVVAGVRLDIPAGALTADATISIAARAPADFPYQDQLELLTPVFVFQPEGLQFALPVTVTFDPFPSAPDGATVFWSRAAGGGLEPLACNERSVVTGCAVQVTHFSWGLVGKAINSISTLLVDYCQSQDWGMASGRPCCAGLCGKPLVCSQGECTYRCGLPDAPCCYDEMAAYPGPYYTLCNEPSTCMDGWCRCTPDCSAVECGPDPVCRQDCGSCSDPSLTCRDGVCYPCIPNPTFGGCG
jgi:hypothetical protein